MSAVIAAKAGIGLRFLHHRQVLQARPQLAWVEVHTENYMGGGPSPRTLDIVRGAYPLSLHGVGLSLGSVEGVDRTHLARVRDAVLRFSPALISEHLSWSTVQGTFLPDLLPLPMTEEALEVICRNVDAVQSALGRTILVENPSTYVQFAHSTIPEWELLAEVARRTGCGLLCDVNNIFVSSRNHGWDEREYLRKLPSESIREIHLAGHSIRKLERGRSIRIDDHGSAVCDEVWNLYEVALELFGAVPTLIEWDNDVPALEVLMSQAERAQDILDAHVAQPA